MDFLGNFDFNGNCFCNQNKVGLQMAGSPNHVDSIPGLSPS